MNKLLALCATSLLLNAGVAFAQQVPVKLGQIVPLSGPLANVGKEINVATLAALANHNLRSKPRIELVTQDDANNPERSAAAVQLLDSQVSGLLSCFGTVGCLAQMKAAEPLGLPLIAPIAGAPQLRGGAAPLVFAVRASASEELGKLLKHCQVTGMTNLAVVVQDDGFGQSYFEALKPLLDMYKINVVVSAVINPQKPEYASAVAILKQRPVNALLLLANSTHSLGVLKAWRVNDPLPFVLNLAGQANGLFANGLKGYTGAAAFVTATPSPWGKKLLLQREYHDAMDGAGIKTYSYLSFEAYINARIAIEAVKRSKDRSHAALKSALIKGAFNFDGLEWQFGAQAGVRYTDLSLLLADGTFRH